MKKLRVLVLMHSKLVPPEDVSKLSEQDFLDVKTEHDVLTGLAKLGHEVMPLGLIDDLGPLRQVTAEWRPDVVFNLLEEFRGNTLFDQNVVSYLELMQIPYTGCNPRGLMIARDKALSKKILHYHRIRVPKFAVFSIGKKVQRQRSLEFPLIVKPQVEEASTGIAEASVVYNDEKLAERVGFVHATVQSNVIVEEYIDGRELYVGLLGNGRVQALPVWELRIDQLRPDAPKIATHTVKWNLKYQRRRGVRIARAENLPEALERELARTSKRIYRALELSGYARIDYRLDAQNRPYFLEANPNPDIGNGEEIAAEAHAAGIGYESLLQRILNLGLHHSEIPRRDADVPPAV